MKFKFNWDFYTSVCQACSPSSSLAKKVRPKSDWTSKSNHQEVQWDSETCLIIPSRQCHQRYMNCKHRLPFFFLNKQGRKEGGEGRILVQKSRVGAATVKNSLTYKVHITLTPSLVSGLMPPALHFLVQLLLLISRFSRVWLCVTP